MKSKKIVLRPGIQLIEYDHPDVLFSQYGNPQFYKLTGSYFPLDEFLNFVSKPQDEKAIQKKFSSYVGFADNFKKLVEEEFFVEVSEKKIDRANIDTYVNFLSHFHPSINTSKELLKECEEFSVAILDHTGLKSTIKNAFSDMKFRNLTFLSSHTDIGKKPSDMLVVVSSWKNAHKLIALNRWCLDNNQEYFLVMLDMFGGSVGPLLGRKHGPCFKCLLTRRNYHETDEKKKLFEKLEKWAADQGNTAENEIFEPFAKTIMQILAIEIFKLVGELGDSKSLFGLKEIDLFNIRTQYHEILPTPRCSMCYPRLNLEV